MPDAGERERFLGFLVARGRIGIDAARRLAAETTEFREAIAVLAIRHDLIDPLHVEQCLENGAGDFLEMAVKRRLLAPEMAERLRSLQQMRELQELAETLVLRDLIPPSRMRIELAVFLNGAMDSAELVERGID